MDPRSMALEPSYLVLLYANIAKVIEDITQKYNAATKTSSIGAECSAISAALNDIQALLSHPQALSSLVMSQIQLENILKNVYNSCNMTIVRLEDEVGKCAENQTSAGQSASTWNLTQLCDEVLIKALLRQIQRQIEDASLLIVAAKRNSSLEIRQLLKKETFTGAPIDRKDQFDALAPSEAGGYSQSLWENGDADSRSVCTRASDNISRISYRSGPSEPYSPIGGRAASVISASASVKSASASIMSASSSVPPLPDKAKKVPRAQMGSIFFKLFKSNTELHKAAKKGDAKKIKALLDLGVDINYEGSSGCTALHLATDAGHEAVVQLLLSHGADAAAKSSEGRAPLHTAARLGNPAVVRLLLEKVVDVHARDPSGSTALHIAAYNGQESVVQILVEKHPWLEVRGPSGFTALQVAAFNGQSAVVRLLVEMGADLEARSDTGRTALQLAAERGHEAVVRYLLLHGANIMVKDSRGRTALEGAVSNQHGVVAQLLLDKAVSPEKSSNLSHHPSSTSGPTYELSGGETFFKVPGSLANKSSAWSQQTLDAPIYELPGATVAVPVEMPAGDMNGSLRGQTSPQRMNLPSHYKR